MDKQDGELPIFLNAFNQNKIGASGEHQKNSYSVGYLIADAEIPMSQFDSKMKNNSTYMETDLRIQSSSISQISESSEKHTQQRSQMLLGLC